MNFSQALEFYKTQRKKLVAVRYFFFISGWDMQTTAAQGSIESASEQVAMLAGRQYELTSDARYKEAVQVLFENSNNLDEVMRHEIECVQKEIAQTEKIPKQRYEQHMSLAAKAYPVYVQAKHDNDFAAILPYLEQLIQYNQDLTLWWQTPTLKGYDVLLDMYEHNFTTKRYDEFFQLLKQKILPVVGKLPAEQQYIAPEWSTQPYYKEGQKKFCNYLMDVLCFDKNKGLMKESEHPFTNGFGTNDVRITNHYYEENVLSSVFSVLHETGHALYEQQCDANLNGTFCSGGASMGMHESQSRFYENMIGRSKEFWQVHFKHMQQHFPVQLKHVSLPQFLQCVNAVKRSFVRTEADELTYPMHIIIRYEIEKELIDGCLKAKDLPQAWNEKYRSYLGIVPPTDTLGVLQDCHWASGDFGYFPTYALGSAIAAQLFAAMQKQLDVAQCLQSGNTAQINSWLKEHVHKYGASKYPDQIVLLATGEQFNPNYYVDYLLKKFG